MTIASPGASGQTHTGCGVHPTLGFGDVKHRRGDHYDFVSRTTRSLLRQSTYCGVHVHVPLPNTTPRRD